MKISSEEILRVTLELNREEAHWLKGVMQNPLHGQIPSEEDEQESIIRKRFFTHLDEEI